MSFHELLERAIDLLRRHGRLSYRALRLELNLDDDELEAIKDEIIYSLRIARDEARRVLIYTGDTEPKPSSETGPPSQSLLAETPKHLADRIRKAAATLEGERKHVTVMFADIRGSTELVRDLDPEDAREILYSTLQVMTDPVHRYEGTVNLRLGDGIMALFGAPLANEDHALRACCAALDMQAAVHRFSDDLQTQKGISIGIGIGLNSGDVVVGTIDNDLHMEYEAIGQTTHLAARLQGLAEAGSVIVSSTTAQLVEGFAEMTPRGPVPIKGLTDPITIFELRHVTSGVRKLNIRITQGLTRFVGRENEMATIGGVAAQAKRGHGQVVALVGEPGVGKSRLVYEILNSDMTEEWTVLESSSVSYGKVRAYFPVIDLLRRYFELDDNAAPTDIAVQVTDRLVELEPSLKEVTAPILSLLEALPSGNPFENLEPREKHRATLDALKRLLLSESRRRPLLIVFEDLHCIDNGTQAFLDNLVETLPMARLLLLVNYRTQYRHNWWHKTYYTQLQLSQLSPDFAQKLLIDILGSDPTLDEIKAMLVELTEGNPFFLEEMVRSMIETSILEGERGAYRLTQKPERLEIPSTVQAVLAARIDRLTPKQKELLQTSAVIGRNVPLPLLQAVSELDESDLQQELSNLIEAEFIYEARLYPERAFTFKHALTNEVAYESLLREKRRALHAKIVIALEKFAGDRIEEQVERIAPHALRGGLWDKAVRYFWEAGTKGVSRSAFREALLCFESALEALDEQPNSNEKQEQTIDLCLELRNVCFLLGDFDRVHAFLQRAEDTAKDLGDEYRLGRILNFTSSYFGLAGKPDQAIAAGERALSLNAVREDPALGIVASYYTGIAYHNQGQYRRAIDIFTRALAMITGDLERERFGTTTVLSVICRTWLTQCLAQIGVFDEGVRHANDGIRIASDPVQPYSLIYANCSLGILFLLKGDLDDAICVLEKCQRLCESSNIPVLSPLVDSHLGSAYALSGNHDKGLDLLEGADQRIRTIGRKAGRALRVAWLSHANLLAGRKVKARSDANRALELAREHEEFGNQAWVMKLMGELAAHGDAPDAETAELHYAEAIAMARRHGMRPLQAHCHRCLGTMYNRINRSDQARTELSTAAALYRDMGMSFWLKPTEAALEELA